MRQVETIQPINNSDKGVELVKCLQNLSLDWADFGFYPTDNYERIIHLDKVDKYDIFLCIKNDGDRNIWAGHLNNGTY